MPGTRPSTHTDDGVSSPLDSAFWVDWCTSSITDDTTRESSPSSGSATSLSSFSFKLSSSTSSVFLVTPSKSVLNGATALESGLVCSTDNLRPRIAGGIGSCAGNTKECAQGIFSARVQNMQLALSSSTSIVLVQSKMATRRKCPFLDNYWNTTHFPHFTDQIKGGQTKNHQGKNLTHIHI